MAQEKKDGGKASQKKRAAEKKASEEPSEKAALVADAEGSHDEPVHAAPAAAKAIEHEHAHAPGVEHAHDAGHEHKPNRKEYFYVFLVLAVLTVLEVAVAQLPGISRTVMGLVLVSLAVTKAATVGLYYMHLKHETKWLRLTVAIPMSAPAIYALVLITEGAWRLAR